MPAREWWTCSIPSACARSGILAVCLIVYRRNAARMSMIPFSLVEMCAKSMCYNRRAYAPRTRGLDISQKLTASGLYCEFPRPPHTVQDHREFRRAGRNAYPYFMRVVMQLIYAAKKPNLFKFLFLL